VKKKRFSVEQIEDCGRDTPDQGVGADVLPVEEAVRRLAVGPGAGVEATAGRECTVEAIGCRLYTEESLHLRSKRPRRRKMMVGRRRRDELRGSWDPRRVDADIPRRRSDLWTRQLDCPDRIATIQIHLS